MQTSRYPTPFFIIACILATFCLIVVSCAPQPAHAGQREDRAGACQLVARTAAVTQHHRRAGHTEAELRAALEGAIAEAGVDEQDAKRHLAALAAAFALPEQYGPQAVGQEVFNACMLDKA